MKKKLLYITLILLCVFVIKGGVSAEMKKDSKNIFMKIFFIPFEVSTYIPVTMNDIEDRSLNTIWFAKDHVFSKEIKKILESNRTDKTIDNKVIRLKVVFLKDNHIYYIDQNGIVLKDNKIHFLLSKEKLNKIEKSILYFSGIVDVEAAEKLFNENEE